MPKISVHLEADSAEEFQALLAAFHVKPTERWDSWKHEPKGDGEPDVVNEQDEVQPAIEVEQPAAEVKEPVKPKRGRPFKTAPVDPEPTVIVQPEPQVVQPVAEGVAAPAVAAPKPAKAKEPEIVVSRQDLLDAFSEYVQRYGASFGFSDISSLLQKNLGDGVRKASDVPEDKLPVAIGAIKTAIADNPFNRKRDYA